MGDSEIQRPILTSLQDLTIITILDPETDEARYVIFYHISPDDNLYFGQLYKHGKDITLAEYNLSLNRVEDEEVYPLVPEGAALTIAPSNWDDTTAFIKRPGLSSYEIMKGTAYVPTQILQETLIMEQLSMAPHPNIITYLGCQVKRGRITAIVLERLGQTLTQLSQTPAFRQLDQVLFLKGVESAVQHIHSLGLAHNDINPDNIMIKDGTPVLIDFGSCQPFGANLQSLGTDGWYEEDFFTSEAKHDEYSLKMLKEWLQKLE
jgi:serine/threonine protein kinase